MFPVIQALRESELVYPFVVATGQHQGLCSDVLTMAGVVPDVQFEITRRSGSINELSSQITANIGGLLEDLATDDIPGQPPHTIATIVHGDTTSASAGALASAQAAVPVIHVEAGLRTYNLSGPLPEELNRQLISRMSFVQIAPTPPAAANLIREQANDKFTFVSGNTSIDALQWATAQPTVFSDPRLEQVLASTGPVVVATLHRRENWPHLAELAGAFNSITAVRPDVRVVLPMHPNPKVRSVLNDVLGSNPNVLLIDALGYIEFAHLLARVQLAITDSGGIQEEAPSVGTPVLVCREETERAEGIEAGTLLLVGTDPKRIVDVAVDLLDHPERLARMADTANPFGGGRAALRIRELIEYLVHGGNPPDAFGAAISRAEVLRAAGYRDSIYLPEIDTEEHVDALAEAVASPGTLLRHREID